MITPICRAYGVGKIDVLTGFKYIGEQIKGFEETGSHTYLFGFEESYGCLAGTYARDKDGVYAAVLVCEMAAYYKEKGMTLYEALLKLYEAYGYYRDGVKSMTMKGLEGMARIQRIMKTFRENTPPGAGRLSGCDCKGLSDTGVPEHGNGGGKRQPSACFGCTALYTGGWDMGMYPPFRYRAEAEILHRREGGWSAGGTG